MAQSGDPDIPIECLDRFNHLLLGIEVGRNEKLSDVRKRLKGLDWPSQVSLIFETFLSDFDLGVKFFLPGALINAKPGEINPQFEAYVDQLSERICANARNVFRKAGKPGEDAYLEFEAAILKKKGKCIAEAKRQKFALEAGLAPSNRPLHDHTVSLLAGGGALNTLHPVPAELNRYVAEQFAIRHEQIAREFAARKVRVLADVRQRGNMGGYLPALTGWASERVREAILTKAEIYVRAADLFQVPCDSGMLQDLGLSAEQIAGGMTAAVIGEADLLTLRLKNLEVSSYRPHRRIEEQAKTALREAKQKLEEQAIKWQVARQSGSMPIAPPLAIPKHPEKNSDELVTKSSGEMEPLAKKRGRPSSIADADKIAALQIMKAGGSYGDAAKKLYNVRRPTAQQTKNASKILDYYQKKLSKLEKS